MGSQIDDKNRDTEINQQYRPGKEILTDPSAKSASWRLPAFLARPWHAPVYHGFPMIEETRTEGWCLGAITEFLDDEEGCEWGDAYVVAPDGSRAGIVWEEGEYPIREIMPPDAKRWGVYAVWFPKRVRTVEDFVDCFRAVLPQIIEVHEKVKRRSLYWKYWRRWFPQASIVLLFSLLILVMLVCALFF